MKLDWTDCVSKKIVKRVGQDSNLQIGLRKIAQKKFEGASKLSKEFYYSKITLLYDAIRTNLEILALKHGYKIYNHQCYVSFLKEIMDKSELGDSFNRLRIIRNGVNYMGTEIELNESLSIISDLKKLYKKLLLHVKTTKS